MATDVGSYARTQTLSQKELGKAVIVTNQVWTPHCPHGAQTHSEAPRPIPSFPGRARNKPPSALSKYLFGAPSGGVHTRETGDPHAHLHGADILTG